MTEEARLESRAAELETQLAEALDALRCPHGTNPEACRECFDETTAEIRFCHECEAVWQMVETPQGCPFCGDGFDRDLDAYQVDATRTANGLTFDDALVMAGLGAAGEAGEVADLVKKYRFHGHELDRDAIVEELGDVLWYVAIVADILGVKLSDVADRNVAKLRARYPEGFDEERSRNRADIKPQGYTLDGTGVPTALAAEALRIIDRRKEGRGVLVDELAARPMERCGLVEVTAVATRAKYRVKLTDFGRAVGEWYRAALDRGETVDVVTIGIDLGELGDEEGEP